MREERNWAGNFRYNAMNWHEPETVEHLQELVSRCRKLKALGSRHSFNSIADTDGDLISLQHLDRILELDRERNTVTIQGGVKYGPLSQELHRQGYALHNMASLPHISVAGACATATHGSGVGNGNLATAVSALQFIRADGERVTLSREHNGDLFPGAVVHLGALGIITQLTLDIRPTFSIRQDLYENLPLSRLESYFEEIFSSAYSVSLFTDWKGPLINQVWLKSLVTAEAISPAPRFFTATRAERPLHPIKALSAESCNEQMGIVGPWQERLPHFRLEYTPSVGDELQSEFFVARENAFAALHAIHEISGRIAPVLQISEVRTIAADDLWMSPCFQRPSVAFHFTWKPDGAAVEQVLKLLDVRLAAFDARPHWGKLFTMAPERLRSLYPKLPEFQALMRSHDPDGKFHNAFLDKYLLPQS